MSKPVILTGLRANNDLHIGNYFGALLPLVDMAKHHADEYEINLFVPDLHSFTTPIDHSQLHDQILHNLRLYVAAGLPLDHPNIHIYRQSYVPAHSELAWILDCFTGFGEMNRMTQFKDKSGRQDQKENIQFVIKHIRMMHEHFNDSYKVKDAAQSVEMLLEPLRKLEELSENDYSVGLFNYPVLMAADILLYNASYVPVGEDQTQHLEFARDIAQRLNSRFGDLFTIPKPVAEQHKFFGNDQGLRIKDLVDPSKKMSKSDESGKGIIFLGDEPNAAAKKIKGATTDSLGKIDVNNSDQVGIQNLLQLLSLATGRPIDEIRAEYNGQTQYGPLKVAVADAISTFLSEFQTRLADVNDDQLMTKLEADEQQMNEIANATLYMTQKAVGLRI